MLLARGLHEQACQVTWEGSKWDTTPNNHKKKKKKTPENSQTSKQKKAIKTCIQTYTKAFLKSAAHQFTPTV